MQENWEIVYRAAKMYKVEFAQDHLDQNNIDSVIMKKKGSAFLVGEIELYVHKDNLEKAQSILKEYNN